MFNSTEPDYVFAAVGYGYALTGAIIIPLHAICSHLMWQDKNMRNPTYEFMINLSVADALELIPLGLYAGIILILGVEPDEASNRIMGWFVLVGWYTNCVLLVFVAFSRYIAMAYNHLYKSIFSRRNMIIMHSVCWIVYIPLYFCACWLSDPWAFEYMPAFFTWGFNVHAPLGLFMHWWNFGFNLVCAFFELGFNTLSLMWVHKTRKQIQSIQSSENRRREILLLLQSFIVGSVFTVASIFFTIVIGGGITEPMAYLCMQIVWTLNHCNNPIVYLTVNSKLRRAFIRLVTFNKYGHGNKVSQVSQVQVATVSVRAASTANHA